MFGCRVSYVPIDGANRLALPGISLAVEDAGIGEARHFERIQDQMRLAARAQRVDQMFDIRAPARAAKSFGVFGCSEIIPELGQNVASLSRQDHDVGIECVEITIRIEQFLAVRIEGADLHDQIDPMEERERAENRNHRLDGERAQDCQTARNQRQMFAYRRSLLQHKLRVGRGRRLVEQLAHQTERAQMLASFDRADNLVAVRHR